MRWTGHASVRCWANPAPAPDDTGVGHHPDIILSGDRAYMFYFVQPGTSATPGGPPDDRRSSLQVVELKYDDREQCSHRRPRPPDDDQFAAAEKSGDPVQFN